MKASFPVIINIRVAAEHGLITWSQYHKILVISFNGTYVLTPTHIFLYTFFQTYEGWNFNSGNYLFTTDTK